MSAIDSNTLLDESKCYLCLGVSAAEALKLALLNRIAAGGGGSANWELTELGATAMPYSFNATSNTILIVAFFLQAGAGGTPTLQVGVSGTALKLENHTDTVSERRITTIFARSGDTVSLTDATSAPGNVSIQSISIYEQQ